MHSRDEAAPTHSDAHEGSALSVVVPVYNEEDVLATFHSRLAATLSGLPCQAEIIYVNDGSSDSTLQIVEALREEDHRVSFIDFTRNFGKEIAIAAGLNHANGEAVVIIDADLQDPPELIPEMMAKWREGFDVVYAQREARDGETYVKKATAWLFYRVLHLLASVRIPEDTGDFRLLSRRAVDALKQLREQHRFMKGLFAWIGFPQTAIRYKRDPRWAGKTKWSYWKLWNFALEGITSFAIGPLKLASYLGLCVALGAFAYAGVVIYKTLVYGDPVAGYPSLMVVILFLGGVQLITLGIIGEYLGRVFDETKRRPLYLVETYAPARSLGANRTVMQTVQVVRN